MQAKCRVVVVQKGQELEAMAAREVARTARAALRRQQRFSLALAGGNTPRGLYSRLALEPFASCIAWPRMLVFWGDERCVPADNPGSNYRMALETLLSKVPIPDGSVHRIQGEVPPASGAAHYEACLRRVTGQELPRLDLVLLGMGVDGHTASLFPGSPGLTEKKRLALPALAPRPPRERVTLSLRVLNAAHKVLFLVQGEDKAAMVRRALERPTPEIPASLVRPEHGRLIWLLDRAAAGEV